jgi:hypothetical protein
MKIWNYIGKEVDGLWDGGKGLPEEATLELRTDE